MPFIEEYDTPELLKASVNGKPGFVLLPQGEDDDGIYFTSRKALLRWVCAVELVTTYPEDAQPYEEWLEGCS